MGSGCRSGAEARLSGRRCIRHARRVPVVVRPIGPHAPREIALVAERMRQTLVEVLGEARGTALYTMEWLVDRVRFHLDPARSTGAVFLAESTDGGIAGHTIVRVEAEDDGRRIGLFSTIYVDPAERRSGVAAALLRRGELWMAEHALRHAVTYTAETNARLIALFEKHGYAIVDAREQMVKLERALAGSLL